MSVIPIEVAARRDGGGGSFHDSCLVVIPAANTEKTIFRVVSELRDLGFKYIRVIDTGSVDSTALRARAAGAEVAREQLCGFGRSCPRGLDEIPHGIAWILFCNGDGSDDPSNLDALFAETEHADLVIGNRTVRDDASLDMQRFGNWILSKLIQRGWGVRFATFGTLRLVRREALDAIQMRHHGWGWNVVMQIRAIEARLKIREVPVRRRTRESRRSTFKRTIADAASAAGAILQAVARLYFGGDRTTAMGRDEGP